MTSQPVRNPWFEKRRDLFVTRLVKEFHATQSCFRDLYQNALASGRIPFADIRHLVGTETDKGLLWRLKDRCHQLWRGEDPNRNLLGSLLDWLVGSLFHEAMKLKENSYIYQFYGPLADEMRRSQPPGGVRFCGAEQARFLARTATEMERQLEHLGFMFGRASYLLRTMLPQLADNPLLLRLLVENRQLVDELWHEELEPLFHDLFGSVAEGYCRAGRSFAAGNWRKEARSCYELALAADKQCIEARNFLARPNSFLEKAAANNATMV